MDGGEGCRRRHHRLLQREANVRPKESGAEYTQQKAELNSAFRLLKCRGILLFIPVIIQNWKNKSQRWRYVTLTQVYRS